MHASLSALSKNLNQWIVIQPHYRVAIVADLSLDGLCLYLKFTHTSVVLFLPQKWGRAVVMAARAVQSAVF